MSIFLSTDYKIKHAQDVIFEQYGDTVRVDEKKKDLVKFGTNPNVGTTRCTIWNTGADQANETFVATDSNTIDSISSSSGSDTQVITIEGHTQSGGDRTFVSQNVTLNGTTRVALTTGLNRVTRAFHAGQTSTNLVGNIYIYENTAITSGKPTDTTKIHLSITAGENQSQKASTTLSSQDYWIITGFGAGSLNKTGTNITEVRLEWKSQGGVFRPISKPCVFSTGNSDFRQYNPYIIIPPNADIRLTAISSAASQSIVGDIQGYLAIIV